MLTSRMVLRQKAPPGMIMFTIFAAITMMEFLKERLIYMTDNNLMYRQLPGFDSYVPMRLLRLARY